MRVNAIPKIVDVWYHILTSYQHSKPNLVNLALDNLKSYVGTSFYHCEITLPAIYDSLVAWIDINLIANDRMLSVLFNLLRSDELGESVIDLFIEVLTDRHLHFFIRFNVFKMLNKGMSPRDKVALMHTLKLPNLLAAVKVEDDDSKVDFFIKCARLVNTMGVEAATAVLSIADAQVNGAAQQVLPPFSFPKAND